MTELKPYQSTYKPAEDKAADEASGLDDALESEDKAKDPVVEKTGGTRTTDTTVHEVESHPRNTQTPK